MGWVGMAYSYDRTATAHMELHDEWRNIVAKHQKAEDEDFEDLLKKAVNYLKSAGYDLDLQRSYLSKYHAGSDGYRREGYLVITEREENVSPAPNAQSVISWVREALGVTGHAKILSSGPGKLRSGEPQNTWGVDITQS